MPPLIARVDMHPDDLAVLRRLVPVDPPPGSIPLFYGIAVGEDEGCIPGVGKAYDGRGVFIRTVSLIKGD